MRMRKKKEKEVWSSDEPPEMLYMTGHGCVPESFLKTHHFDEKLGTWMERKKNIQGGDDDGI